MIRDPKVLGNRVNALRSDLGIDQEELARRISYNRHKVSEIEKGRAYLTYSDLLSLADALEVSPEVLTDAGAPEESSCYVYVFKNERGNFAFRCKFEFIKDTRRLLEVLFGGLIRRINKHDIYSALEAAEIKSER